MRKGCRGGREEGEWREVTRRKRGRDGRKGEWRGELRGRQ